MLSIAWCNSEPRTFSPPAGCLRHGAVSSCLRAMRRAWQRRTTHAYLPVYAFRAFNHLSFQAWTDHVPLCAQVDERHACKKFACAFQACLKQQGFQNMDRCQREIDDLRACCREFNDISVHCAFPEIGIGHGRLPADEAGRPAAALLLTRTSSACVREAAVCSLRRPANR